MGNGDMLHLASTLCWHHEVHGFGYATVFLGSFEIWGSQILMPKTHVQT